MFLYDAKISPVSKSMSVFQYSKTYDNPTRVTKFKVAVLQCHEKPLVPSRNWKIRNFYCEYYMLVD